MIWLYNILLTLGAPIWLPWMWFRSRRRNESVDWKERTGDYRLKLEKGKPRLWLHAVSVGEVVAAQPILREVRRLAPEMEIVLSVTTSSGHRTARETETGLFDHLVYFPIDVYRFVLAALVRTRPKVVAIMETELWMNFLDAAQNIHAKTLLVNGRISDRSFPRARLFRFFYKHLLARVDRCLMQSETDAARIKELGANDVAVLGNCKFDQDVAAGADPEAWRQALGIDANRPVVVVGSTRSEVEEALVAGALAELSCQTVWAPRHLERAEPLSSSLQNLGFSVGRRSLGDRLPQGQHPVLLLDTFGELAQVYSVADVVVIGGAFDDLGGQNIIQPLALGKPVVHGPHMQNFREAADGARRVGASRTATDSQELRQAVQAWLDSPADRAMAGQAGADWVAESRGSSTRYAQAIVDACRDA